MKNHSEMLQVIKNGTELQAAAEYISKTESGYIAKIANLWQKVGEAVAENGSLHNANALLEELRAFYPANRLGEKATSIAKAASAKGMKIHYYQLIPGRGNPSAFHTEPKAREPVSFVTATEEVEALNQCLKVLEKDIKRAETAGDKVEVKVCKDLQTEYKEKIDSLAPRVASEKKEKDTAIKTAKLQAIYDDLMSSSTDTITIEDLEQVILAATADKLAAEMAAGSMAA